MIVTSKLIKIIVKKVERQFNIHKSLEELGEGLWATIANEISSEFAIISNVEVKQVFLKEVLPSLQHCNFGLKTDTLHAVENLQIIFEEITGCVNTIMSSPRRRETRKSLSRAAASSPLKKPSQPATNTPLRNPSQAAFSKSTSLRSQDTPITRSQLLAGTEELAGIAFDTGVIVSSTQICDYDIKNASFDASGGESSNIPFKKRMIQEADSTAFARTDIVQTSFSVADSDSFGSELLTSELISEDIEEHKPRQADSTELIAENDFHVADSDSSDSELITSKKIPKVIKEQNPGQADSTERIAELDFDVADSDSSDEENTTAFKPRIVSYEEAMQIIYQRNGAANV